MNSPFLMAICSKHDGYQVVKEQGLRIRGTDGTTACMGTEMGGLVLLTPHIWVKESRMGES